jgi:hypothetical protein
VFGGLVHFASTCSRRMWEVRVEEAVWNLDRLGLRLGMLMLRMRLVVASLGRVQPGVLVGCVTVATVVFHSSRGGGIVVLTSTVASRKRVRVLRRTGDRCLHGSLPVPFGKAGDGSIELSKRGRANIQRFDVRGATMSGCRVQHALRHAVGDSCRTCAMARRI